jgi:hypothetical protein
MKVHLKCHSVRVITSRGRMTGVHTAMCPHGLTNQATNPERLVTETRSRMQTSGQTDSVTLRRHLAQARVRSVLSRSCPFQLQVKARYQATLDDLRLRAC